MPHVRKLSQWRKQFEYQQGLCCWCNEPMDAERIGRDTNPLCATWEHIIPRGLGGTNDPANLVLAHKQCNHNRGRKPMKPRYRSYAVSENENG